MLKDNDKKRKLNPSNKAYMNSYDWNYMILELVDYIEENLSSRIDGDDDWKYCKMFCSLRGLNWRVIKKMIEFSVVQVFNSEADLIEHETFKSLELKSDTISETMISNISPKKETLDFNLDVDGSIPKTILKKDEGLVDIFK